MYKITSWQNWEEKNERMHYILYRYENDYVLMIPQDLPYVIATNLHARIILNRLLKREGEYINAKIKDPYYKKNSSFAKLRQTFYNTPFENRKNIRFSRQ